MVTSRASKVAGVAALLFLAFLGGLLYLADVKQLGAVVGNLDHGYLALALATTAVSYLFNYLAFRGLVRACECPIRGKSLFRIAFASATVSYLVSAGGLSAMTVRLYLLGREGIRTHTTLLISLVSTMLNNVVLLLFVVVGFGRLLLLGSLNLLQEVLSALIVALSSALVIAAFLGLYNRRALDLILDWGVRLVRRLARALPSLPLLRRATEEKLHLFRLEFRDAVALITSRRRKIAVPFLYLLLDWLASAAVLYFCFLATGYRIGPGSLAAGFALGVFMFLISVVPGGLGIMEASMAALYVSLGVPLEEAIVALVAYRVFYYFIPFGLSLLLCGPLLREAAVEVGAVTPDT